MDYPSQRNGPQKRGSSLRIPDNLYDQVTIPSPALTDIVESLLFQRLRRIRQLGTVSYVYPTANHTRFEHSIGVFHLANRFIEINQGIDSDSHIARVLQASALLHDIGHTPFSHVTEIALTELDFPPHEDLSPVSEGRVKGAHEIISTLDQLNIDIGEVQRTIRGEGPTGPILSGPIDLDRLDYLPRDAYYTGTEFGTIDQDRALESARIVENSLAFPTEEISTIFSILINRFQNYENIYDHPTARVTKLMLKRATIKLLLDGVIAPTDLRFRLDDFDFLHISRNHPATSKIMNRIDERRLYKVALSRPVDSPMSSRVPAGVEGRRQLEAEIEDMIELPPDEDIIIDLYEPPLGKLENLLIEDRRGSVQPFPIAAKREKGRYYALLESLSRDSFPREFRVYCPPKVTTQTSEAIQSHLAL